MEGETVIVRTADNQPVVLWVWGHDSVAVYVTDYENLRRLESGQEAAFPIGFPWSDVFSFRPGAMELAAKGRWDELEAWAGSTNIRRLPLVASARTR